MKESDFFPEESDQKGIFSEFLGLSPWLLGTTLFVEKNAIKRVEIGVFGQKSSLFLLATFCVPIYVVGDPAFHVG